MPAGCTHTEDIEQLKAFLQTHDTPVCGMEYRVMPPDAIAVSSTHVPEINGVVQQIRPDGKISLPLVGELFVAGRTPEQIEQLVAEAAREYYTLVDATVQVSEYKSHKIYVFGEVMVPGPQPWTGADTLRDVLAKVQPTLLAWPERIKVVRAKQPARGGYLFDPKDERKKGAGENRDGAEELRVDLMAMVKSGDMSRNILLRPDDIVYVPPHPSAAAGLALMQLLFPTRPVLEAVRVPVAVDAGARPFE